MEKAILVISLSSIFGALAVGIVSVIMSYHCSDVGDANDELDFFGYDVEILESENDKI